MEAWKNGGMEEWRNGRMEEWENGGTEERRSGGTEERQCGEANSLEGRHLALRRVHVHVHVFERKFHAQKYERFFSRRGW